MPSTPTIRDSIHGVVADFTTHLGGDFDVENFEHVVVWDAENEWIEMRLRSDVGATVTLSQSSVSRSASNRGRRSGPRSRQSFAGRRSKAT